MFFRQCWNLHTIYSTEKDRALARILSMLILMSASGCLIGIAAAVTTEDWMTIAVLLLACALLAVSFVVLRCGHLRVSTLMFVGSAIGSVTLAATVGQGIRDVALLVFPIIFVYAGLTLDRRFFAITVALALVAVCWLGLGDVYGWFISRPYDGRLQTWSLLVFVTVFLLIAAVATNLLVTNMRKSLDLAQKKNSELKKAEETLRHLERSIEQSIGGFARVAMHDGSVVFANKAWARMHGYEVGEVVGKHFRIFHTREQMECDVNKLIENACKFMGDQAAPCIEIGVRYVER